MLHGFPQHVESVYADSISRPLTVGSYRDTIYRPPAEWSTLETAYAKAHGHNVNMP